VSWDFVTERDIPSLLQLTIDTYKESEWSDTDWDIKKIERMLYRAINEPHQFFIKVEKNDKIIGYLLGHYQDYFHNDKLFATALKMMRLFINWAKGIGVKEIYFEPSVNKKDITRFDSFAKKLGMEEYCKHYRIKV
jgi:predicted urease superfamily metal-dependent hydrolase